MKTYNMQEIAMDKYNRIMNPVKVASTGDYMTDYAPSPAQMAYKALGDDNIERNVFIQDCAIAICGQLSQIGKEAIFDLQSVVYNLSEVEDAFLAYFVWC